MAEAHVMRVGLPDYERDVIVSVDRSEKTPFVKIFVHCCDKGSYIWLSPADAEELGVQLQGMAHGISAETAVFKGITAMRES